MSCIIMTWLFPQGRTVVFPRGFAPDFIHRDLSDLISIKQLVERRVGIGLLLYMAFVRSGPGASRNVLLAGLLVQKVNKAAHQT